MGSFTDQIPKFNPYIQQLPVEAMVAVGMEKQKRYDEGVQKIQTSIDNIAGLSVSKDVEKAYLQSKLNELGNNLKGFAAADFSNSQMVNSVTGMTNQLASDPYIQTAVNSSAKRKKEIEFMEKAREKGELTPQNEAYFAKRDSAWANNTELGQSYNAKYNPYFDWKKFTKETFDALKIDELSSDKIFELDANGNPKIDKATGKPILSQYMTTLKEEGYKPERLQAAITQIFSDPRVNQQLSIDGEYSYRGVSEENMIQMATRQTNVLKNSLEDDLDELSLQLNISPNDPEVLQAIKKRQDAIASLPELLKTQAQEIVDNPDGARANLYKEKTKLDYTTMFNFSKKSEEIKRSPAFDVQFELQKETNRRSEWGQEFQFKKEQAAIQNAQKSEELRLKGIETSSKSDKNKTGGYAFVPGTESTEYDEVAVFENNYQSSKSQFENTNVELVWQARFASGDETKINANNQKLTNLTNSLIANGTPPEMAEFEAKKSLIAGAAKASGKEYNTYMSELTTRAEQMYNDPKNKTTFSKNNPNASRYFETFQNSKANFEGTKRQYDDVNKQSIDDFLSKMDSIPVTEKQIRVGDKLMTLTKQDRDDLALIAKLESKSLASEIYGTDQYEAFAQAAKTARNNMIARGKGELIDAFLNNFVEDKKNRTINTGPYNPLTQRRKGSNEEYAKYLKTAGIFDGVYKAYDAINDETFAESMKNRAGIIRRISQKDPNMVASILPSDKVDATSIKTAYSNLVRVATFYKTNENLSTGNNMDDFISGVLNSKPEDSSKYQIGIENTGAGPRAYLMDLDNNKLYITNTESKEIFKVDVDTMYEPSQIKAIKSTITNNQGKSIKSDLGNTSTYRSPAIMNTKDFPGLAGMNNYDAKVHFEYNYSTGEYFPYVYIRSGNVEHVEPMEGNTSLNYLISQGLPSLISGPAIDELLILRGKKK
jgi:hypothetical protein